MIFDYNLQANHIYSESGKREIVDSLINRKNKQVWLRSLSNEWGKLVQGNNEGVKGTDIIDFIYQKEVPNNKDVMYATFICNYHPLK